VNLTIKQAVESHNIIAFWYKGLRRLVEPHTYGINKGTGNEDLSAYQIECPGELPGWKNFLIDDITQMEVTNGTFAQTRPGYNPNDSKMSQIFARA
jgi:hypothetical protein